MAIKQCVCVLIGNMGIYCLKFEFNCMCFPCEWLLNPIVVSCVFGWHCYTCLVFWMCKSFCLLCCSWFFSSQSFVKCENSFLLRDSFLLSFSSRSPPWTQIDFYTAGSLFSFSFLIHWFAASHLCRLQVKRHMEHWVPLWKAEQGIRKLVFLQIAMLQLTWITQIRRCFILYHLALGLEYTLVLWRGQHHLSQMIFGTASLLARTQVMQFWILVVWWVLQNELVWSLIQNFILLFR